MLHEIFYMTFNIYIFYRLPGRRKAYPCSGWPVGHAIRVWQVPRPNRRLACQTRHFTRRQLPEATIPNDHRSSTFRLKIRVGRQQRVVHDHAFATPICITPADYRKRRCRQPNFDATLQFAGQSLATPASASRPGTHLNNDKPSQLFAGQFLETTASKIKSARGESQHKLPKRAFRRSAN